LTGGEGDPLNASLGAAAVGFGLRDSFTMKPPEPTPAKPIDDKPYESIEPWLNVEVFTYEDRVLDPEQNFFHVHITTKPNHLLRVIPKDVIFILDASASITQEKLDRFAQSITKTLAMLNPIDRFNIVTFSDKPSFVRPTMMPVTAREENEVRILLGTIKSQGATDLYGALSPLMSLQPSPGRLLMLFLLSDGKPTAGIVDSAAIINRISDVNNNRATIFDFGGPTANQYLLDLLAFRNRGRTHFADHLGAMEQSFVDLYADVRNPLLMNLQFLFSGVDTKQVFPQALPHLYQDSALDLYGRYNPRTQKTFAFRLVGETYAEKKELFVTRDFPTPDPSRTYMPTQWAQGKIYYLIGELVKRDTPESRQQILALGKTFKIKVPYIKAEGK
jgi:Ca-activated chloride channel family protein